MRQQKSGPLADSFEGWPRAKVALISQKIKLAEAIRYALSRRQGLTRVIELDNNTVERSISSTKLRRKNALFADSDGGAEHRAVSPPWSRLASSTESIRSPISPTS